MHQLFTKAQLPDVPLPIICTRRLFALCTPAWLAEPNISVQIRCTERLRACCDLGKGIRGLCEGLWRVGEGFVASTIHRQSVVMQPLGVRCGWFFCISWQYKLRNTREESACWARKQAKGRSGSLFPLVYSWCIV